MGHEIALKRTSRFLISTLDCSLMFPWQDAVENMSVMTQGDWAVCKSTRRPRSGLAVKVGKHLLVCVCTLQKCVALSSGEAEFPAQVATISEGCTVQKLCSKCGLKLASASQCWSTAARGILTRVGTGKLRHKFAGARSGSSAHDWGTDTAIFHLRRRVVSELHCVSVEDV